MLDKIVQLGSSVYTCLYKKDVVNESGPYQGSCIVCVNMFTSMSPMNMLARAGVTRENPIH